MQIKIKNNSGGVLVGTIILTALLGSILAGYLSYLSHQNRLVARSVTWNSTIPLAEAGIEEALAQLNQNGAVVANNGFEIAQSKYIVRSRTLSGGSYTVGFSMATNPVIVAEGSALAPISNDSVSRTVKVRTKRVPMFSAALVAEQDIDINGVQISIDSFDSGIAAYNTGGSYDPAKRRDKAKVATNSSLKDSVKTGGAKIYGKVVTGAGGSVLSHNKSIVGDLAWHASHPTGGIDPNAIADDFNLELGIVVAPFTSGFPPEKNFTTNGITYDYVLRTGDYKITSPLSFKGNVLVTGNARLYIAPDSSMSFGGTDVLEIAAGGSLEIYNAAPSASIAGHGFVNTGAAKDLSYFGLPTNTQLALGGNATFVGSVYAPNADVTLKGGGSTVKDFCGAIVAKSIVFGGNYNFHFDEALTRGRFRNFVATSWEEIGQKWNKILAGNLDLTTLQ